MLRYINRCIVIKTFISALILVLQPIHTFSQYQLLKEPIVYHNTTICDICYTQMSKISFYARVTTYILDVNRIYL